MKANIGEILKTRQRKHCGFCIYLFDKYFDQSNLMVRLVRAEKMVLSGLVTPLNAIEHYRTLLNIIGLGYTELYWVVLGCNRQYWAVLGSTGIYWALLGCSGQ